MLPVLAVSPTVIWLSFDIQLVNMRLGSWVMGLAQLCYAAADAPLTKLVLLSTCSTWTASADGALPPSSSWLKPKITVSSVSI